MAVTHKDGGVGWAINDVVDELAGWGSSPSFKNSTSIQLLPGAEMVIGAEDCDVVLDDPTHCVSRKHARMTWEAGCWTIHDDLGSTNGVWQDGERRLSFQLVPGVKIKIGGVTLVARSERLRCLRDYLARMIGWSAGRRENVDRALDSVRDSSRSQTALVIYGAGDLTRIARRLHALTFGAERPFAVIVGESRAVPQLDALRGGTICLVEEALPRDQAALGTRLRRASETAHVMLCGKTRDVATLAPSFSERSAILEIPALQRRIDEHDQLLKEYLDAAVIELSAPGPNLREHDMDHMRRVPLTDHDEIEELARRVVAHRNWKPEGGAERLGISRVALNNWLQRRNIPT